MINKLERDKRNIKLKPVKSVKLIKSVAGREKQLCVTEAAWRGRGEEGSHGGGTSAFDVENRY